MYWSARPGLARRLRLLASLPALAAVAGCESDEDTTATNPFVTPVEPSDVLIERADLDEVVLRWIHDDDDETGFTVRRIVGNTNEVIAELPANTTTYTDQDPNPEQPNSYRIAALYDGQSAQSEEEVIVELDFLAPPSASASLTDTGLVVRWLPPDFEQFDGFQLTRILERSGDAAVGFSMLIPHFSSEEVRYVDEALPSGAAGDRLRYQIASHLEESLSPPTPTGRFQWSFPTRSDRFTFVAEHTSGGAHFLHDVDAAVFAYARPDGGASLDVFRLSPAVGSSSYLYRYAQADGRVAGTMPDENVVVLALDTAASPGEITISARDPETDEEIWSTSTTAPMPGVSRGPAAGSILVVDGNDVITLDGASGVESSRMAADFPPVLARRISGALIVILEQSATGTALRAVLRQHPSGTPVWEGPWVTGSLLPAGQSLLVSPGAHNVAVNVESNGQLRSRVTRVESGESYAELAGRVLALTREPEVEPRAGQTAGRALIQESADAYPITYRLEGPSLVREDTFGAPGITTAIVDAFRPELWSFHSAGVLRVFTAEIGWAAEAVLPFDALRDGRVSPLHDLTATRFEIRSR